mgnify:CR=1 FL=1
MWFAMGMERLLELLKQTSEMPTTADCDVYVVHQSEEGQMQAIVAGERLRDAGLNVVVHCATASGVGSFKSQMKKADASGAAYALIIGEDEIASGKIVVKDLRSDNTQENQTLIAAEELVDYVIAQITGDDSCCDDPNHVHLH